MVSMATSYMVLKTGGRPTKSIATKLDAGVNKSINIFMVKNMMIDKAHKYNIQ